jgi:hypothetical protein
MGLINFYCRFISSLKPLTDCMHGGKTRKDPVDQSAEFLAAINAAMHAIAETVLLAHPTDSAELCLMVGNSHSCASLLAAEDVRPPFFSLLASFLKSWRLLSSCILPSTGNCGPAFPAFATSATCLKGGHLKSSWITNLSHWSLRGLAILRLPGSVDSCLRLLNT